MRRWLYIAAFLVSAETARAEPLGGPAGSAGEDAVARRAIRGQPVELAHESEALRQLRQFEEESFPKSCPLPVNALDEGPAPPAPRELASADSPPSPLRSPGILSDTSDAQPPTAVPWLATLTLPDLPVRFDAHLVKYLDFYKNDARGRAIMSGWLRAQGRYRALIDDALRRAHLPRALLYVSMIESGYDPDDRSTAGAVGLWQFMPEAARIYGLRIDHWVDERKDPERATAAQMHYFDDLHARFGSWHMALAAFNAGYGAVLRAIGKYNTNDYWEICRWEDGLPWETTLYVPKALAAAIVGENRAAFGYADLVADPPLAFDRAGVTSSMSFTNIAKAAGVPVEEVARLNPDLRRQRTPPGPVPWDIRLPRGAGARFAAAQDRFHENLVVRAVRFGERLEDIGHEVGAQAKELRRINGISDAAEVVVGLPLLVPAGRAPLVSPSDDEPVIVAVTDKDASVAGRKRVFYRTLPGDTLADVSTFFHISASDVTRENRLDADARFTSRQVLELWVAPDFDERRAALLDPARVRVVTVGSREFFDLVEARNGRKRVAHIVKKGDTLASIARRYHFKVPDLERINRFGRQSELHVGQSLTVYVPMTAAEKAAHEKAWRLPPAAPIVAPAPVPAARSSAPSDDAETNVNEVDEERDVLPVDPKPSGAAGGKKAELSPGDDPGL